MFILPDLPYSFDALEPYIDSQTMQIHHDKHHGGYVKNLNDLLPDKSDADLEDILQTSKDQKVLNNAGGHFNHSLFWKLLTSAKGQGLGAKFLEKINLNYGSFDEFKKQFSISALGHFGSGWIWLTQDLKIITTPNQNAPKEKIVLGLDVWEHAYYLKYQNRRAEYIDAFWNIVNWDEVNRNLV